MQVVSRSDKQVSMWSGVESLDIFILYSFRRLCFVYKCVLSNQISKSVSMMTGFHIYSCDIFLCIKYEYEIICVLFDTSFGRRNLQMCLRTENNFFPLCDMDFFQRFIMIL